MKQPVLQLVPESSHVLGCGLLLLSYNGSGSSETNYAQHILCSSPPACFLRGHKTQHQQHVQVHFDMR